MNKIFTLLFAVSLSMILFACDYKPTSDKVQQDMQEKVLKEATAQTGMPNIKNWRNRKLLKYIQELCDQEGLITYTYLENMNPVIVRGHTALGGKLTFFGETIGYGIPYATQYTNPQKAEYHSSSGWITLPQADPDGLFRPASAEGTWIIMNNPNTKKAEPVYVEPRTISLPFKLPMD